jgi:hypothetical protein
MQLLVLFTHARIYYILKYIIPKLVVLIPISCVFPERNIWRLQTGPIGSDWSSIKIACKVELVRAGEKINGINIFNFNCNCYSIGLRLHNKILVMLEILNHFLRSICFILSSVLPLVVWEFHVNLLEAELIVILYICILSHIVITPSLSFSVFVQLVNV